MNDFQTADHSYPAAVPLNPAGRPYAAPAARTSWGALALAFIAGGFTCFVVMSLLAIVCVVVVSSLGTNANTTFQSVSDKVSGPDEPTFKKVSDKVKGPADEEANPVFQKVSDKVKGPADDASDPRDEPPPSKDR